ncbi:MAG: hypothetical protein ACXW5U_14160 [Thermoanaerobaculia bacterium]
MRRDFAAFVFSEVAQKIGDSQSHSQGRDFRERNFAQTRDQNGEMFRIPA